MTNIKGKDIYNSLNTLFNKTDDYQKALNLLEDNDFYSNEGFQLLLNEKVKINKSISILLEKEYEEK